INVPIVALGLFGIARVVPETKNPHPQRLDFTGLVVSVVGLVSLVFGIIHASETKNWLAPSVLLPMAFGVAVIALFVFLEWRSDHRSFDVSLFKNRGYAVSLAAVSLSFFAMTGILFALPFYLQILRGYDTLAAGLCFLPFAVGQVLAAPRSAAMVVRFGYRTVMTTGLVLVGLALIGLTSIGLSTPLWWVLVMFFGFGFGMGNVIAPASTLMQNVLPLARAGAGSAVQNTVRQVFGAFGVAVIGTVMATTYARHVADALAPLPTAARTAAADSVGATVGVLDQALRLGTPPQVVTAARDGAFDAFLSAFHVTATISAGVVLLAALVVGFLLPHINPPHKGETPAEFRKEAAGIAAGESPAGGGE
ncbi:MAG TPA: MFS transporter, partial [Actinomycetes bacterium]|nr:MFS transporter [Actinomycetes bacterium]